MVGDGKNENLGHRQKQKSKVFVVVARQIENQDKEEKQTQLFLGFLLSKLSTGAVSKVRQLR